MDKRKLALLGGGIFLAGALAGALGAGPVIKYVFNPAARMERLGAAAFYMERMDRVLGLSAEQKTTIQPILEDMMAQVRQAKSPCREAEEQAIAAGQERIAAQLDSTQAAKYKAMTDRFERHRKAKASHAP